MTTTTTTTRGQQYGRTSQAGIPQRSARVHHDRRDPVAERTRRRVKNAVGRKVAVVVGAFEGLGEGIEDSNLPETAGNAIRQAGRTTRNVAETARDQASKLRKAIRGGKKGRGKGRSKKAGKRVLKKAKKTVRRATRAFRKRARPLRGSRKAYAKKSR